MRRMGVVLAVVAGVSGLAAGSASAGGLPHPAAVLGGGPAIPVFAVGVDGSTPAERQRSRTAFTRLSPARALAVVRREHPALAAEPLWQAPVLNDGERIERFDSPSSALVGMVGSSAPSRVEAIGAPMAAGPVPGRPAAAEDLRPIDLSLRRTARGWSPVRSAVATTLPTSAEGRIAIGDAITVGLGRTAADSVGAVTGGTKVFYPGVAADTDAMLEPLPDGVSVSWVVRSAAGPQRLPLAIDGARAAAAVGADGSLTLHDAGGLAGTVSPPRAWDADGIAIPARIVVRSGAVEVVIEHRERDVRYPIAIDPVIRPVGQLPAVVEQDDDHGTPARPTMDGWSHHTFQPSLFQFYEDSAQKTITTIGSGDGSAWFAFDPIRNSAPYKAQFANVQLVQSGSGSGTCQRVGIVNPEIASDWGASALHRYWTGSYSAGGATPWNTTPAPPATSQAAGPYLDCVGRASQSFVEVCATASCGPVGPANSLVAFQLNGTQVQPGAWSWAQMSGAYIFHRENVPPTVTASPNWTATEWDRFDGGMTLEVAAHDDGVGLCGDAAQGFPAVVALSDSLLSGVLASAGNDGCTGMTYDRPAPSDQSYTVSVPADEIPEGRRTLTLKTVDAVGNQTTDSLVARVDRSGPEVTLSGSLYVDRLTEVAPTDPPRPLTVSAADGNPGGGPDAQRSGVQRVEVYVDDELVHEADQTAAGDSPSLSTTWMPDAEMFTSAEYTVEVVVIDRVGNESSESFVVKAPCCSTELDDGSVAVGDRLHTFGDLDGDGTVDVALVDEATGNVTVARGNGDGTFATQTSWGTFGTAIDKLVAGNVDGNDETAEAESTDDLVARAGDGTLLLRLSDGETLVTPDTTGLMGLQATWPADRTVELADVDGDGLADLVGMLAATRQVRVAVSLGAAFESSSSWATVPAGVQAPLGDLNGDGMADLVLYDPASGDVDFRRSTSIGFEPVEAWGSGPTAAEVAVGDLDGNALADAIFRTGSGTVTGRISSRDEGFTGGTMALGALAASFDLHLRDVTGDGRDDVLGARVQSGALETRSASSTLRDSEAADSTADDPDLPDEDGPGVLAPSSAKAPAPPPKATLMMSDDNALKYEINLGGRTRSELLLQMKYLGAEKVRTIAWWGQIDRLHPDDERSLVPVDDPASPIPAQDSSTRPTEPRVMRLARDAADLPSTQAVDDPRAEWIENPASGQPGHNAALRAGGEWVIVRDRFYVENLNTVLSAVAAESMTAHVTISGGTSGYTKCSSRDTVGETLQVRGCRPGDQTGERPSPKRAGHAIASIAEVLRVRHGSMVESIGIWNEPNLSRATFLSREGSKKKKGTGQAEATQLNRAALYGEIYANTYGQMSDRGMLTSGGKRVKIAFGELTSKTTTNNGHATSDKTLTPERWVEQAVAAAGDAAGVSWPGGIVRADIFAVHPYQPARSNSKTPNDRPWQVNRAYPWGVRGVSAPVKRKNNSIEVRSVKAYLGRAAGTSTPKLRRVGAAHATAPHIWATEFGYYTSKKGVIAYNNESLSHAHPESERKNYMTRTKTRSTKYGALPGLSRQGGVKVIGLWEVLEDPPPAIVHMPEEDRSQAFDDYGFIGSGSVQGGAGSGYGPDGNGQYVGQILRVGGTRPYGPPARGVKKPSPKHHTLQWPQTRSVACAIRSWADPGTPPVPGATSSRTC